MLIHPRTHDGSSQQRPFAPAPSPPPAHDPIHLTLDLLTCHLGLLLAKARRFADLDLDVDRLHWDLGALARTCPAAKRALRLLAGGLGNAHETLDPERIWRRLRHLQRELHPQRPGPG